MSKFNTIDSVIELMKDVGCKEGEFVYNNKKYKFFFFKCNDLEYYIDNILEYSIDNEKFVKQMNEDKEILDIHNPEVLLDGSKSKSNKSLNYTQDLINERITKLYFDIIDKFFTSTLRNEYRYTVNGILKKKINEKPIGKTHIYMLYFDKTKYNIENNVLYDKSGVELIYLDDIENIKQYKKKPTIVKKFTRKIRNLTGYNSS
jgi:hypothetical protein